MNYYHGPLQMTREEQILINQSGDNDIHIVMFGENSFTDKQAHKQQKVLRKFAVKNTDTNLHYKYWVLEDAQLAKRLGIDKAGDLYVIRETDTVFN